MKYAVKDPSEVLDFTLDLTAPMTLDADTISTHTVTAATGITKASDAATTTTVTAWLSGGTHGVDYPITYRAVTSGGRTYERTIIVRVRNR